MGNFGDPLWVRRCTNGRFRPKIGTETVYSSGFRAFRALKSLAIAVAALYGNLPRPFSGIHKWSSRPFVVFRIDPLWVIGATHKGRNSDPLWAVPRPFKESDDTNCLQN